MKKPATIKSAAKTESKTEVKKIIPQLHKRSIRFQADPMTLGYIDLTGGKVFKPQLVGLVVNESYAGCSLVLLSDVELKSGQQMKIKDGVLDPIKASIIWVKHLDENIYKVGIKFLE